MAELRGLRGLLDTMVEEDGDGSSVTAHDCFFCSSDFSVLTLLLTTNLNMTHWMISQ